ncbi:MAG: hypothetical protein QME90_01535 [Thermodesulfobacteriota bacterium]|nr:hypothetical protein [Thermodesulfobacteriota bacterium]
MMKHGEKGLLLFVAALVVAIGFTPQAWAQKATAESFAQKDQTIEYHFMLIEGDLTEKNMTKFLAEKIIAPLKPICDIEPLSKPRTGIYVDSRDRVLDKNKIILRVREGLITTKARALAPEVLLDLEKCSAKKYEMDYFDQPEYSISSDIRFKKEEFDVNPSKWTIPDLLGFMGKQCPALADQLRPVVKDGAGIEIPGVAIMYGADLTLKHPMAKKAKGAGISVWFFPPTNKAIVELAFGGYVRDRGELDQAYAEIGKFLKSGGLLKAEQVSKTEQYFNAYFKQ